MFMHLQIYNLLKLLRQYILIYLYKQNEYFARKLIIN